VNANVSERVEYLFVLFFVLGGNAICFVYYYSQYDYEC
jgi:hypothetical protein